MVDNLNPTNQFHPYQRPTDVPVSERPSKGFGGLGSLGNLGNLSNVNFQGGVNKVRDYARNNPSKTLGALAALVIGMGMLRGRR